MSYTHKSVLEWNRDDVLAWLNSKNLTNYTNVFAKSHINGYDLFFITSEDLKTEMGISRLHDRLKILREIRNLILHKCNIPKLMVSKIECGV